jgi:hypothetical protein
MFTKGSRYRILPESSPIDAAGERRRGKQIRLIPETTGQFLHTVREGDRLDLLSFKYYGDATRWWQIADANPQAPFPADLLDQRPIVHERFVLRHPGFETRLRDLVIALGAIGPVTTPIVSSFEGDTPADPNFVETTLVVRYPPAPATHQAVVDEIGAPDIGFHFLRSFAWDEGPNAAEAFTFDDPAARDGWRAIEEILADAPGVLELESFVTEGALEVIFNSAMARRGSIVSTITSNGFVIGAESVAFPRTGTRIVIPPNQIV